MTDLVCHSVRFHDLLYHHVPFFIHTVKIGPPLTAIILWVGALSLQVDNVYALSLYAEMFKVAVIIIEVDCWFILAPR